MFWILRSRHALFVPMNRGYTMKIRNFILAILILCGSNVVSAASKDLLKYVPQNTFFAIGADFDSLRTSDLFVKLENEGRIWSFDRRNNLLPYLQALNFKTFRHSSKCVFKIFEFLRYKGGMSFISSFARIFLAISKLKLLLPIFPSKYIAYVQMRIFSLQF